MTSEELNKLEQQLRQHKDSGQTSNITLKVAQVERLVHAAREGLSKADILDFNIAAEIRKEEPQERRYQQRWADAARQEKFEKVARDRLERRKRRREELLTKWKTYAGSQKLQIHR